MRDYTLRFLIYWTVINAFGTITEQTMGSRNVTDVDYAEESLVELSERLRRQGYSVTSYSVETSDGYVLRVFRVSRMGVMSYGAPVLVMHGLLQSGAAWLDAGPSAALGYLLATAGHDLWLGNARGSHFSRRHTWQHPDHHDYWRFCVDEIGKYDLPAIIDYILTQTGAQKINYIGYSQGAGTFFIMCSERPEYCDKVKVMIGLAPATRHLRTKSVLFRTLTQFFENNEDELNNQGIWEVFAIRGVLQSFLKFFCATSDVATKTCEVFKDVLDAPNPGSVLKSTLRTASASFPAGTSVHNMARYGQSMKSKYFQKFDYGPEQNLALYGSTSPPVYNLSAVTIPTVIIYGRNDGVVDISDVKWLLRNLPNVVEAYEVKHPSWTHFDVVLSRYTHKLLFPKIDEYLNKGL